MSNMAPDSRRWTKFTDNAASGAGRAPRKCYLRPGFSSMPAASGSIRRKTALTVLTLAGPAFRAGSTRGHVGLGVRVEEGGGKGGGGGGKRGGEVMRQAWSGPA
eukprot:8377417-Pyramimonas_sp.AAC.1